MAANVSVWFFRLIYCEKGDGLGFRGQVAMRHSVKLLGQFQSKAEK
jgi:hypothetical protein